MIMHRALLGVFLMCLHLSAEARPETNPFVVPPLEGLRQADGASAGSQLELRAVLTGGKNALANINGDIVSVGEKYRVYTLMEVTETTAVLKGPAGRLIINLKSRTAAPTDREPDNE